MVSSCNRSLAEWHSRGMQLQQIGGFLDVALRTTICFPRCPREWDGPAVLRDSFRSPLMAPTRGSLTKSGSGLGDVAGPVELHAC
jgi:hypothetical protein